MQLRSMITVVAVAALAGCGLKGPLYLPGEKNQTEAAAQGSSDKNLRPRPAPQVQKEMQKEQNEQHEEQDAGPATETEAPVTPVHPDRPNPAPVSGTP